jgi:hypothetical protein
MPKRLSFSTSPIGRHLKVPKLEIKENKVMSKVNIYIYIYISTIFLYILFSHTAYV